MLWTNKLIGTIFLVHWLFLSHFVSNVRFLAAVIIFSRGISLRIRKRTSKFSKRVAKTVEVDAF